ncbi:MAG: BolA family protein [Legionella sp.]|jgi:BolA protein
MSRKQRIQQQLEQSLSPIFLSVEDESNKHHVPEGAETHFKVIAVSTVFNGLSRIERHKMINRQLAPEFEQGLHALSLHLFTESEWQTRGESVQKSPGCKDGYGA